MEEGREKGQEEREKGQKGMEKGHEEGKNHEKQYQKCLLKIKGDLEVDLIRNHQSAPFYF